MSARKFVGLSAQGTDPLRHGPKFSVERLEKIVKRFGIKLARLGKRGLQHNPDGSAVLNENEDVDHRCRLVDFVQRDGLKWTRQASDVFSVKESSLARDLDKGFTTRKACSQPSRMGHSGSGQRYESRVLSLPSFSVRLTLPLALQQMLPSHVCSGREYCDDRADSLHPARPLGLGHAERPPVDPKQAVLGRRHSGSPRLARIVARSEAVAGSVFEVLPPATQRHWRAVLGFSADATVNASMVKERYRSRASSAHPDKGGTTAEMAELNQAREDALKEVS